MSKLNRDHGLIVAPNMHGIERAWALKDIVVRGVKISPTAWFDGSGLNATAKTWTCRQTATVLSESGAGTSRTFGSPTPIPGGPMSIYGVSGQKQLIDSGASFCNVTTEDIFTLLVLRMVSSSSRVVGKTTATNGFRVYHAASAIILRLDDGADSPTALSGALTQDAWHVITCSVNRDEASANGMFVIANGTAGAGANGSAAADTITNAQPMSLAGYIDDSTRMDGAIALYAQWQLASMFSAGAAGAAEMLALHNMFRAALLGLRPVHSHATLQPEAI